MRRQQQPNVICAAPDDKMTSSVGTPHLISCCTPTTRHRTRPLARSQIEEFHEIQQGNGVSQTPPPRPAHLASRQSSSVTRRDSGIAIAVLTRLHRYQQENMTLSTKPEVHNVSLRRHRRLKPPSQATSTENLAQFGVFGHVVPPEICSQTKRETDIQTHT